MDDLQFLVLLQLASSNVAAGKGHWQLTNSVKLLVRGELLNVQGYTSRTCRALIALA